MTKQNEITRKRMTRYLSKPWETKRREKIERKRLSKRDNNNEGKEHGEKRSTFRRDNG